MPASLDNTNISDTFRGLLHAQGTQLPSSGQVAITDGFGQETSLSLGVSGQGARVTGTLTCDAIESNSIQSNAITCDGPATASNTPKAWVLFSGTDGTIVSQYNVSSVVKTGGATGDYTITFTSPLSSGNYVASPTIYYNNTTPYIVCAHVKSSPAPNASSFGVKTFYLNNTTPTPADFFRVGVVVHHL